jgi:hypothetical protein
VGVHLQLMQFDLGKLPWNGVRLAVRGRDLVSQSTPKFSTLRSALLERMHWRNVVRPLPLSMRDWLLVIQNSIFKLYLQ